MKGCDLMSILQEYEQIKKELGTGINKGIELYLSENPNLFLSDIKKKNIKNLMNGLKII